jgi:hypothetical protein
MIAKMIEESIFSEPKSLVSEALSEILPEDGESAYEEMSLSAVFVVNPRENSLMGNLSGVEIISHGEKNSQKVDVRVTCKEAFDFIKDVLMQSKLIETFVISYGYENIASFPGPYKVLNAKIVDVEPTNKFCTLAIDLFKILEIER